MRAFWASTSCRLEVKEDLDTEEKIKNLVTRIAATSNRKSLATAIATQKNHSDSENTSNIAISLRVLREKLATSKL